MPREITYAEMHQDLDALVAECDQAQAQIDEARALPMQHYTFTLHLDQRQLRLNKQRAEIKKLRTELEITERKHPE